MPWWRDAGQSISEILGGGGDGDGGGPPAPTPGGGAAPPPLPGGGGGGGGFPGFTPLFGGGGGGGEAPLPFPSMPGGGGGGGPSGFPGFTPLYPGGGSVPGRPGGLFGAIGQPLPGFGYGGMGSEEERRRSLGEALRPALEWFRGAQQRVQEAGGGELGESLAGAAGALGEFATSPTARQAMAEGGERTREALRRRDYWQALRAAMGPIPTIVGEAGRAGAGVIEAVQEAPMLGPAATAGGEAAGLVGGGLLRGAALPAQEFERAVGGAALGIEAARQAAQQGLPLPEVARVAGAGYRRGREELGPVAYSLAGEQLRQAVGAIGSQELAARPGETGLETARRRLAPLVETPAPAGVERAERARELAAGGATPQEIAEQAGSPIAEAVGQTLLDPLNFLTVGAAARRQAAETGAVRRHFIQADARSYDEVAKALKRGADPRPAAGPIGSVANVINPRTQAARAEALIEDTSDVVTMLTHQAQSPEQRLEAVRNLVNLADPDPQVANAARQALADFGDIPESQAGKQATTFLRELARDEKGQVDVGVFERMMRQAETPEAAAEALVRKMDKAAGEFYRVKSSARGGVAGAGFLERNPVKRVQNAINGVIARYFHLGYSPSYAHRNLATNMLHALTDGNLPLASAEKMGAWAEKFGYRTRAATRAVAGAAGIKAGEQVTARFKPISMGEAYRTLLTKDAWKQGPSLALGQAFEQHTSERIWYKATRDVWERSWRYGKAIPADPVVDSLPGPMRRWLVGRVNQAMDAQDLRAIMREVRGRQAPELWRMPDETLLDGLRQINPDLADEVLVEIRTAQDPAEFTGRLDELTRRADEHTTTALADDTPMLAQGDPAGSDVMTVAQTEGPGAASEMAQRIAGGRQQRDAARVMAWSQLGEAIPARARQTAQQVADWVGQNVVEAYRAADEATARWLRRELPFEQAEALKQQIWDRFAQARDAQYARAIQQAGDEARPLLILRQADDAVIAQAARTKEQVAGVWARFRSGDLPYDGARGLVEQLWDAHNRYASTQYDQAWRLLGGDPGRGPLARIGLQPIQRSAGALRRELAGAALDAGIPGVRLNKAGEFVPQPRLLNTINRDLDAAGLPRVRRLSDMNAQQMEAATQALRRRAAAEITEAAPEAARALETLPPERAVAEVAQSLAGGPPTRAVTSAEANARAEPILARIRNSIPAAAAEVGAEQLDPRTAQQVENWLKSLPARMNETKAVAASVGGMERDFALLNYSDRRLSDQLLGYVFMYSYWPTRTGANWLRRMANNPAALARYMRLKQAQEQMQKDLPEWWRDQVGINLFGNKMYMNIEQTLNPLYGFINDFYDRDRGGAGRPLGELMQKAGDLGIGSVWMPLQGLYALSLANKGDQEGAQAWASYLGTPTRTFHYATALLGELGLDVPAGGIVLEPWLWQGGMFQGGDKWERRRIGKALYDLHREGAISYEQMVDAAYSQQGDVWDQAMQRAAVQRAPGALAGYFLGQGFKTRHEYEIEIDRASGEWYALMEQREGMTPEQYAAARDEFLTKYPWMPAIWMSKKGDAQRDTSMAWEALNRLPPGDQRRELLTAAKMDEELLNRFYSDGGDMSTWSQQDRDRFMASVLDLAATLGVPDAPTKAEWAEAKRRNQAIYAEAEQRWPGIQSTQDEYFRIQATQGEEAARVYLESHPELREYWTFKNKAITDDPLLFAYYGEPRDLERRAINELYDEAERRWPGVRDIQDEYFRLKDSGGDYRAYLDQHPELREYWDFIRIGKEFIAQFPPEAPGGAAGRPAALRPDVMPATATQQAISATVAPRPGVESLLGELDWQAPTAAARAPGEAAPTADGVAQALAPTAAGAAPAGGLPQTVPQLEEWRDLIESSAEATGLDPRLLATVLFIESRGRADAESEEGAVGLMQVMPREAGEMFAGRPTREELLDPTFNVQYGAQILQEYIDYYDGDVRKGLAAYYAGRGYVDQEGLEGEDAQYYLNAFDQAWQELWGGEGAPAGGYAARMMAATEDPLAWTFQHGTQEDLDRQLRDWLYDEAERRWPGMREVSAEYGRMKERGASKTELRAFRDSHPGITDYWDFTRAGREYIEANPLEPGGSQSDLRAYLDRLAGGTGGAGVTAPIALTTAQRYASGGAGGGDFHLGPRRRQYRYRLRSDVYGALPQWAQSQLGGRPYATPLYGQRGGGGGGGWGGGGGGRRRPGRGLLRRMSPALLAQLFAFFAGGPPLEAGALRELQALGIGDVESLRSLFVSEVPAPMPGGGRSGGRRRSNMFWRAF